MPVNLCSTMRCCTVSPNEGSLAFREKRDGILTLEDMFTNVTRALQQEYPDHIFADNEWVFNCAGGFKTGMLILHASLTEYVIFWGSAVHTVGMSGRHAGEFHDFLMTGSFGQWKEGTVHKKLYQPGDHVYHGRWRGSVVELAEDTWMLEHMVGIIPWSLPFGLADSVLSNQDFITVGSSLWTYARLVGYELLLQGKI
ncbi:Sigma non-opioid intracellular receptor 1 [Balamuthia mandrillaris]